MARNFPKILCRQEVPTKVVYGISDDGISKYGSLSFPPPFFLCMPKGKTARGASGKAPMPAHNNNRERWTGGGFGSDPVRVGPPRKRSLAMVMCMVYILVNSAFVFGMVSAFLSWYVFGKLFCGHVGFKGPAKSWTHEPSWGLSDVSGMLFGYCATGGGYHGGGVFGPLGTMVPWGDSPREGRAAHGPLHPAV